MKIDSHQHFWKYDPVRYNWISDDMAVIKGDQLPEDFLPELKAQGIDGSVVVQSEQTEEENHFLLKNAANHDFIKGVVGWVDLQAEDVEDRLAYYSSFSKMKGFRHVLQGEADRALMLRKGFKNGISKLSKFNFTYDILIFADQIKYATELAKAFPEQLFVIDHIAKPDIKNGVVEEWSKDIRQLAKLENVYCKISGMVTEADWKTWKVADFDPFLDVVFQSFGVKKLMFGSDWPVYKVAATYGEVVSIVGNYIQQFSDDEKALLMGGNATRFYGLQH